ELQSRWQLTATQISSWDNVYLPTNRDYNTSVYFVEHSMRGHQAADYVASSQAMFRDWARRMYDCLRGSGVSTTITVGQDFSLGRPSAQFFHAATDYTCCHPWWMDLHPTHMWLEMLPHKPFVLQEVGAMPQRRWGSFETVRGDNSEAAAHLE